MKNPRTIFRVLRRLDGPARRAKIDKALSKLGGRARHRIDTGQVRVVHRVVGPVTANRYFWTLAFGRPAWRRVVQRLAELRETPDHLDHFVDHGLAHLTDPVLMLSLAQHPDSRPTVARWLAGVAAGTTEITNRAMRTDPLLAGAVGGSARLLLEPAAARTVVERLDRRMRRVDYRMYQVIESVGIPANRAASDDAALLPRPRLPVRHRVVIADQFEDRDAVPLLLPGADRVTLLALAETFGRADLRNYSDWPGVGTVKVEHLRTRVSRFSPEYIAIHDATAALAEQVCEQVASIPGLVGDEERRFLTVEIADLLFFQTLKLRAVEQLLADPSVDQAVVAFGDFGAQHNFVKLIGGVEGLLSDDRVELVSIADAIDQRARFWAITDGVVDPKRPEPNLNVWIPTSTAMARMEREARRAAGNVVRRAAGNVVRRAAGNVGRPAGADGRRIVLVTTHNAAYNDSTAQYVRDLSGAYDLEVVYSGENPQPVRTELDKHGQQRVPVHTMHVDRSQLGPFAEQIVRALIRGLRVDPGDRSGTDVERAARWVLAYSLDRLGREVIAPALTRMRAAGYWLEACRAADALPELLVLTPSRNIHVGSFVAAARRFGVPTLVVEAHAQDANYCRYLKIASDYYGVMSDYFRTNAIDGFGTAPSRTVVIGSPRQVAPEGYHPANEQRDARRAYTDRHGVAFDPLQTQVVFFCQPSAWSHVSLVWGHVLEAALRTGSRILLKTHPEESVSRTEAYLEQAREAGASDRVVLLEGDAANAIALGDLVLTGYSAAALDAAVRQSPVVCVTDGDVPYPVDLHAIIGAPIARTTDDLTAILSEFQRDPAAFKRQARLLVEREPHFLEGPGQRLRDLVDEIVARGPQALRPADEMPVSLFLDGPHPVFPV